AHPLLHLLLGPSSQITSRSFAPLLSYQCPSLRPRCTIQILLVFQFLLHHPICPQPGFLSHPFLPFCFFSPLNALPYSLEPPSLNPFHLPTTSLPNSLRTCHVYQHQLLVSFLPCPSNSSLLCLYTHDASGFVP